MQRIVEIVPHNPDWKQDFEAEAVFWRTVFGEEVVAIHHIGSTAIRGISAKPIVDLLVVVRGIQRVDAFGARLAASGYLPRGENGIPGRRFFIKGTEALRTHHIHVFGAGHPDISRHLEFRDYLNAHPDAAQEYGRLKEELAAAHRRDIDGYVAGKDEFIQVVQERAHQWAMGQRR
jgi:GrpB-like predicted nucleotidyltransferase (UPF0157 family)